MIFDDEAKRNFEEAVLCKVCQKPLNAERVRDHSHFDGSFRNALHAQCNLSYQIRKRDYKLPVILHNLQGYDAHLIMQAVKKAWYHQSYSDKYGKIYQFYYRTAKIS